MKRDQTAFLKLCLADALLKAMKKQKYDEIKISAVCELADVGRSTYYRYFGNKAGKDELLVFKLNYEWDEFLHRQLEDDPDAEVSRVLLEYIHTRKPVFRIIHQAGLLHILVQFFEHVLNGQPQAVFQQPIPISPYIMSFLAFGFFGVVYHWIQDDFDAAPDDVLLSIQKTMDASAHTQLQEKQSS